MSKTHPTDGTTIQPSRSGAILRSGRQADQPDTSAGADVVGVARNMRLLAEAGGRAAAFLGRIDHVTLLPNRVQFMADMDALIGEEETSPTVILITLAEARHFNEILRAVGHAYSEDFIRAGAERICSTLGETVNLYHVSVLSFAFLVEDGDTACESVAKMLVDAFARPLSCQDIPMDTRVGVGLANLDARTATPAELLRASLAAAQDSRGDGKGWAWYDRKSDQDHVRSFRLLSDLKSAVECSDQLFLNFQPRIEMTTGRCIAAEALIRWNHPTLGLVSPGEFVPLAEATALITPLTRWVISRTFETMAAWPEAATVSKVSLNISPKNVLEPDFVDFVLGECRARSIDPARVELEFTEGTLVANGRRTTRRLADLNEAGIETAIDDFGSGYSNMTYLTSLPAQILKIDQAFIRPLAGNARLAKLVQSIVALGHDLGYRVVAEGIETRQSYDQLAAWGCDEGQGYLMSKPLSNRRFQAWLAGR